MSFVKNTCYGYLNSALSNTGLSAGLSVLGQATIGCAALPLITIIHELAHAAVAHLLFEDASAEIELDAYGFLGGRCFFKSDVLSKTGKWLGKFNAQAITSAAGPVVQMVAFLALLLLFPGNAISFVALTQNLGYAVSALFKKAFYSEKIEDIGLNDFVSVKTYKGIVIGGALVVTSVALGIFSMYSVIKYS